MPHALEIRDISVDYHRGKNTVHALRSASLSVDEGESVAVMGPSGCGKSTLLGVLGLTILPDCVVGDIAVSEETFLLLPGGNTWDDSKHSAVIRKAAALLSAGGTVGAICGATAALARAGLLDNRPHTSNGAGFLEMFCPGYKGQPYFVDAPSVADGNLITAGGTGALLWAKQIIGRLGVFRPDTLEAWYAYFSTGEAQHFFALMQTLPSAAQ